MRAHTGLIVLLLAGCAREPAPPMSPHSLGAELNLGGGQIAVYIDDELAIEGPLRLREPRRFGPSLLGGHPEPFPLRGSFRGRPVAVECEKQPIVGYPYCEVSMEGRLLGALLFDHEGRAGDRAAD